MKTPRICGSADHELSRRAFFGAAAGGLVGFGALANPALASQVRRNQKRVILLFLAGGASQFETWDPKPGQPTGGPFLTIPTSIAGVRISELMPLMATRLHRHTAIIRSLSTGNNDHAGPTAQAVLRGGRMDAGGVKFPTLGSMIARELAPIDSAVPDNVGFFQVNIGLTNNPLPDAAGFLGTRYEPINILARLSPEGNRAPDFLDARVHQERANLRQRLGMQFLAGRERDVTLQSHQNAYNRVPGLMASDRLFDVSREPQRIRDRYGPSLFGQQVLAARRLIEAGVPFVRVNRGWWDSHGENFEIHSALVPELDFVMSALLDDLEQRGLLEDTLVVTFSEMGRTPSINPGRGRDHWGTCWSVTLSGCGIRPGVVYGSTNTAGTDVSQNRVSSAQFFATIFTALGIDPQKEYHARDGRPVPLTEYGTRPIQEVLA